ncbi:MAG TPA: adenylyl-sulfate kinase [Polyangiaceae bacterium]
MSAGIVVWITGLPSSGKSTFAKKLAEKLRAAGAPSCTLDGDDVRAAVAPALGYSADRRAAFYEMLAGLGALLAGQGLVVLIPATANRRAFRDRARELARAFIEIWVDTPVEECARRDAKGLFARAASGDEKDVPGSGVGYEPPLAPELTAHGGDDTEALEAALELLRSARARL